MYVLAPTVFFQANLMEKKTDRPQPGAHLYNLCTSQNKLKKKRQKKQEQHQSRTMSENGREKHLRFQKWHNFQKVAKMAILQRLWQSKMVTNGLY